MAYCSPCNRTFGSQSALDQHLSSSTHTPKFRCDDCNRSFGNQSALDQHLADSSVHASKFNCGDCNKIFGSQSALDQHLASSIHTPKILCINCDRSFGSQSALDQHLSSAPIHAANIRCFDCDRSFKSQSALDQHLSSATHASDIRCYDCDKSFNSQPALAQHLNSSIHNPSNQTPSISPSPLDDFFYSYSEFPYIPSNSPELEFSRLRKFFGWDRGDPDGENAWEEYRSALVEEFNRWYGRGENDLGAWQGLCRAVGVSPLPQTPGKCRHVCVYHPHKAY